ncbi:MAG: hypothetical protein ACXVCP_17410 [Bdellovibrio sp.]
MKTASTFSALLISSTLMISACTPKDKAVTDNDTRNKILEQQDYKKGGGKGPSGEFKIGGYSAVAVLMERQIEALEIIRLATSQERSEKTQYKVGAAQTSQENQTGVKNYSLEVTSNKEPLNYSVNSDEFKTSLSKLWKVDVASKDNKIISIKAVAEKSETKVDKLKVDKKTSLNVNEDKIEIAMIKAEAAAQSDAELYELTVTSEGHFDGSLDDNRSKGDIKSSLKFKIDGRDLENGKIKASEIDAVISVTPESGKESVNTIKGANNLVVADGLCSSISGKIKFKSGNAEKTMDLDDQKVLVETTKYQVPLAECSHRPTVDISRLFIW